MGWRALLVMMVCAASGWAQDFTFPMGLGGGKAHLASSADPAGGNNDRGNYLRREGNRVVLMESDGPGVITRIWSANPAGTLRIYFDREDKPRVELPFDQLGTPNGQSPRGKGRCSTAGGGVSCTWQMPFAKHARVEAEGVDQLYYQVNYTTLPAANLVTFIPQAAPDGTESRIPPSALQVGPLMASATVPSGESRSLLESDGRGLTNLVIRPEPDTLTVLQRLRIQMTWDGAAGPSVDMPLADLVACGLGRAGISARRCGYGEGYGMLMKGYRLGFVMPCRSRARVVVTNASGVPVKLGAQALPDFTPPDRVLYLCATGHASTTEAGRPHTLLDVTGAGKYVGTSVTLVGQEDLKFLEGDETFIVDGGEKLQGTGTEDYFDGAWFFRRGPFAEPFAGAPTLLAGKTRVAAYRWHLNDAIPFAKSLQATLEHGAHNDAPGCRYRSVAYWYSATPYVSEPMPIAEPLPPFTEKADDRRIIEAETLLDRVKKPEGAEVAVIGDENQPYQASGGKVLSFALHGGAPLVLPLPIANAGLWEVGLRGGDAVGLTRKLAGDGWVTDGRSADSLGYRRVDKGELALSLSGNVHDAIDYLWLREVGKVKGAIEAEDLRPTCIGGQAQAVTDLPKVVTRSAALVGGAVPTEAVCSGGAALRFLPGRIGDRCEVPFEVREAGDLGLAAAWLQSPDQGSAKVLVDGRQAGSVDCRAEQPAVGARGGLGTWRLTAGVHRLTLAANATKPVTLDYLLLKPAQRGHEAECLIPLGDTARTLVVKERFGAEPKWSGGAYVKVTAQAGRPVRFGLIAPRAGRYKLRLVEAKVPGGVAAKASVGGQPVGTLDCEAAGEALGKGAEASVTLHGGLNELALAPQAAGDLALDVVELNYLGRPRWQQAAALALLLVLAGGSVVALRRRRQAS